jgi:hypothetical protein
MNARSPYPDVEIPDIPLPGFVPDRGDERGAAVPLMGPADPAAVTRCWAPPTAARWSRSWVPPTRARPRR